MLKMNIILVFLCLAALVNGLSITRPEVDTTLPEDNATEPETPTEVEDLVNSVPKKAGQDEEKYILKQRNLLKKVRCRPRLTPVYLMEELSPKSDLLDYHLMPEVLAVKRCNSCTYCGEGLHDPGLTCRSIKHMTKNFTIRVFNGTNTVYEKLPIKVDRKCACQRDP